MVTPELELAVILARRFEALGLRYLVGGSVASSLHGVPRTSHDVDLLVDVPLEVADKIAAALETEFYVDADMIREAVRRGSTFNIIHYGTGYKADVFVLTEDALLQEEMRRRQPYKVSEGELAVYFATAEDMVLQKLSWYRAGGESSERQWEDVLGILKVQGNRIDLAYLYAWARGTHVSDLLERALEAVRS